MKVRAYRLELEGLLWVLLVDPARFNEIPEVQREYKWRSVGDIDIGQRAPRNALHAMSDLRDMGYAVIRSALDSEMFS